MDTMRIDVVVPSGRSTSVSISAEAHVRDLQEAAQKDLKLGFLRLTLGGECLHPNSLLGDVLNDGDSVLAIARPASLVSGRHHQGFALFLSNGACVSWGESSSASDAQIAHLLKNVDQIQTTTRAFAAVLEDGKVITWGDPPYGGDITSVEALQRSQRSQVRKIQATDAAFAALTADATVVAWGDPKFGGDARKVQDELVDVQEIQSTSGAFAALLGNGTVVAWGAPDLGGNCSRVEHHLKSIRAIQSSSGAFAAIKLNAMARLLLGVIEYMVATQAQFKNI